MIHDQLIEHTNDAKVRETLLLEPDDLSLSRAITIALRIESPAACASALSKQLSRTAQPPPPCNKCMLQPSQNDKLAAADSSAVMLLRRQLRPRPRPQASRPCDNCGSSSHLSRAQNFPARGQTCCNCGKRNPRLPQSAAPLHLCQPKHPLSFTMSTLHQSHLKHVQCA